MWWRIDAQARRGALFPAEERLSDQMAKAGGSWWAAVALVDLYRLGLGDANGWYDLMQFELSPLNGLQMVWVIVSKADSVRLLRRRQD